MLGAFVWLTPARRLDIVGEQGIAVIVESLG